MLIFRMEAYAELSSKIHTLLELAVFSGGKRIIIIIY